MDIFKAIDPVETKCVERLSSNGATFQKPFTTYYPPLRESVDKEIMFPREEETKGSVML